MRAVAFAALSIGLSATAALARPAAIEVDDFRATSVAFEQRMRAMTEQMADPANRDRIGSIAATYQPEAEAFADVVESRQAAGLSVSGLYANVRAVRALPRDLARDAAVRQRADRFAPRPGPEFTQENTAATGFQNFIRSPRF